MNKVFVFDMDGTIVDRDSNVRPEVIKALEEARAKGNITMIATGRPHADIIRDIDPKHFDYLISNNGAYYYNVKTGEFFDNGSVDKEDTLKVLELAKANGAMYALHANRQAYRIVFGEDYLVETDKNNDPNYHLYTWCNEEQIRDIIDKYPVAQSSVRDSSDKIQGHMDTLRASSKNSSFHIGNAIYLDANPKGISKLLGIESITKNLGIDLKNVVGFGDSGNDIQMVEGVGLGVAMGNASQELKDVADVVIGDNNSDAIADKIRELI